MVFFTIAIYPVISYVSSVIDLVWDLVVVNMSEDAGGMFLAYARRPYYPLLPFGIQRTRSLLFPMKRQKNSPNFHKRY